MVAKVRTVAFHGVEVIEVEIQVTIASGLPAFTVVGLPDKAVAESRERVRAALASLGLALPPRRITVNLVPADVLKEGSHFDLPIALAVIGGSSALRSTRGWAGEASGPAPKPYAWYPGEADSRGRTLAWTSPISAPNSQSSGGQH